MNSVVLIGRLARDVELRYLPNGGKAVCQFSMAVNRELSKDKKQEMETQGKATADFIRVQAWGKQAENCANYLTKGSLVGIKGRIQTGNYTADDGSKKYTFDVVAERVEFLNNKNANVNKTDDNGFDEVDEGDIPF